MSTALENEFELVAQQLDRDNPNWIYDFANEQQLRELAMAEPGRRFITRDRIRKSVLMRNYTFIRAYYNVMASEGRIKSNV